MKEQVIFPEPQDVTILATRKGELTQIPGLEFRAPIVPYETDIKAYFNGFDGPNLRLTYDDEISIKVNGLYQADRWDDLIPYAVPSEKSYSELGRSYTYWKQHPDNTNGDKPSSDPDTPMIVLAEILGHKTVETLDMKVSSKAKLYLPEIYGVIAQMEIKNPQYGDSEWEW